MVLAPRGFLLGLLLLLPLQLSALNLRRSRNSTSADLGAHFSGTAEWARVEQDPKFRWPEVRPKLFSDREVALFPKLDLSHGKLGSRAPLVTKVIRDLAEETEVFPILEVGVWLGGTVEEWAHTSPKVRVVAVDPWELSHYDDPNHAVCRGHCTPELAKTFALHKDEAFFAAAESRLWHLKNQVVLLRGKAPDAFAEVAEAGYSPKLLFLDGGKAKAKTWEWNYNFLTGVLEGAHSRWPEAWLAGDDWRWSANKGGARDGKGFIQKTVLDFVGKHPNLACRMERNLTYVVGPAKGMDQISTTPCA